MFTTVCKEMFKEDNYNETLAYCLAQLMSCSSLEEAEEKVEELDHELWSLATKIDKTDEGLRITSALPLLWDAIYREGFLDWEEI